MKKYISCRTRAEIQKDRDAYKARLSARVSEYWDKNYKFYQAHEDFKKLLESSILDRFADSFDMLPGIYVTVDVSPLQVKISLNYANNHVKHTKEFVDRYSGHGPTTFKWGIDIVLDVSKDDDFEIKSNTSNWAGIEILSVDNLDILMNSVKVVKEIANFDWESFTRIVLESHPEYSDYVDILDPKIDPEYKDPGYDLELLQYEVDKFVGRNTYIWANRLFAKILSKDNNLYDVIIADPGKMPYSIEERNDIIEEMREGSEYTWDGFCDRKSMSLDELKDTFRLSTFDPQIKAVGQEDLFDAILSRNYTGIA